MFGVLSEWLISRPGVRIRGAHWHLRQWLPAAVRTALWGSGDFPVQSGDLTGWFDRAQASTASDLTGRRVIAFSYLPWPGRAERGRRREPGAQTSMTDDQ